MLRLSNVRVIIWHEHNQSMDSLCLVSVVQTGDGSFCEDIQVSADVSSTLKNQCLWESSNSPTVKVLLLHYQITFFYLSLQLLLGILVPPWVLVLKFCLPCSDV